MVATRTTCGQFARRPHGALRVHDAGRQLHAPGGREGLADLGPHAAREGRQCDGEPERDAGEERTERAEGRGIMV